MPPRRAARNFAKRKKRNMKVKLFGLTLFEIERDPVANAAPPAPPPHPNATGAVAGAKAPSLLSDLQAPVDILPRTARGNIDFDAALKMFSLGDGAILWDHRFSNRTAGSALKRYPGAKGRPPAFPPLDPNKMDLATYPARDLPRIRGTIGVELPEDAQAAARLCR